MDEGHIQNGGQDSVVERLREYLQGTNRTDKPVAIVPDSMFEEVKGVTVERDADLFGREVKQNDHILFRGVTRIVSTSEAYRMLESYLRIKAVL